jgi:TPR repeat protein
MAFDVFISYPHQEKATADAACAALESSKIRCWIAPRDVAPGAEWAGSIVHAIDNCRAMVLIFSSHTNQSRQIRREVQRAFDKEKPVVPFRIENVIPEEGLAYYMGPVHWLDALTPPLEQHLQKLVLALKLFSEPNVSAEQERQQPGAQETEGRVRAKQESDAAGVSDGTVSFSPLSLERKLRKPATRLLGMSIVAIVFIGLAAFWLAMHPPWTTVHNPASPDLPTTRPSDAGPLPNADLIAAANNGDAHAQNELGVRYAQGINGLTRNDVKAVEFYRKAAVQGFASAETNLGDMYFFGRGGLDQSYRDAMSWYLRSAQQNSADAQYRLGYMYEKGLGVDSDVQRAVQLYRSAAEHGYPDAQNVMGVFYATGTEGVAQDDKQALDWYRKAADQGFAHAEKNLGDMYFFGHGVDRDYKQALVWYGKAADQQEADAQFRLGYMYEKGLGVSPDAQAALDMYKKAVSKGSVEAQQALNRLSSKP